MTTMAENPPLRDRLALSQSFSTRIATPPDAVMAKIRDFNLHTSDPSSLPQSGGSNLRPLHVLVVDDNPQMRTIVGAVLSAAGVGRLHFAQDGRAGLETLRAHPIDLAFVDFEMPTLNGVEFTHAVRAQTAPLRYLPIVMLTGHSFGPTVFQARDAGINEFLVKPVTARSILNRLEAVIYRPRPFVVSTGYVGPDRRRRALPNYRGPRRRTSDREDILEI